MSESGLQKILVAYDGGSRAEDALALGRVLAHVADGEVTAVCCYWYEPTSAVMADELQSHGDLGHAAAERVLASVRERFGGQVQTRAVAGTSVAQTLGAVAAEEGSDVIVLGSSVRGQTNRTIPSRSAERLLHGGPCAVALAPLAYRYHAPRSFAHVAGAYCGSPESAVAVHRAAAIAEATGARLTIISAIAEDAAMPRLGPVLDAVPTAVPVDQILADGSPDQVIID
ncbi:MAG TPA: universal stress protein, partial [Solirubrobacteraceae bacterium]